MTGLIKASTRLIQDRRGITGLETAIVLIAFVVVASVFAFAVLSTGLLSSEKARTTVLSGLEEIGVALQVKGSIIAHESSTDDVIERVQIPIIAATNEPIDLSSSSLVVTYLDGAQVEDLDENTSAQTAGNNAGWHTVFRDGDSGPVLDTGERAYFWVNLQGLKIRLGTSTTFTIQIKPSVGATLEIERTTPREVTAITNLD